MYFWMCYDNGLELSWGVYNTMSSIYMGYDDLYNQSEPLKIKTTSIRFGCFAILGCCYYFSILYSIRITGRMVKSNYLTS